MNRTTYRRPVPPDTQAGGRPNVMPFRTTNAARLMEPPRPVRRRLRKGWLLVWAIIVTLALLVIWQMIVAPMLSSISDQWHYGDAHVTQMDANVGHGGDSHFLAKYYKGNILVIAFDSNAIHVYTLGDMLGGSSDTVVLLSTTPGTIPSKPDLLVQVQGSTFSIVLVNTGSVFKEEG